MTARSKIAIFSSLIVILLSLSSLAVLQHGARPHDNGTETPRVTAKIAVLNGCGRDGIASQFARKLRDMGFDVVNGLGGNADSFDFDISVVVDRRGDREKVQSVAAAAGIETVLDQRSDNPYLVEDLAVIIGRDWNTLSIFREEKGD